MPGVDAGRHQPVARIGDAGHAGVGDEDDVEPCGDGVDEFRRALTLVAVEVGDQSAGDRHAEVGGEPTQAPGVLGRHDVRRGESLRQTRRGVVGPPDRSRRQDQHASIQPDALTLGGCPLYITLAA